MRFTIGQVQISIQFGGVTIVAPIAGKSVQLTVDKPNNHRDIRAILMVDHSTVVDVEIGVGDGIPY